MENLISKQKLKVKDPIVDTNNRLNGIFKSFNLFNSKFSSSNRLVDLFSSYLSFSHSDRRSIDSRKSHLQKLDKVMLITLIDPKSAIKTIHYATNITSTKAELFTIRCGINKATQCYSTRMWTDFG